VGETTRLVLVRHGEAVCNVEGVVGGRHGCTGLTPLGRAQAARLAERLKRTGELGEVCALYASVLPRAVETAELLAPALSTADGGAPQVVRDCELCEMHPGEADGLTWDEFNEPDWDADPSAPIAPGGEGWSGFVARAAAGLERLGQHHDGETVVVVTHAGVVEASMLRFLPLDPSVARLGLHPAHTSLTVWRRPADGAGDTAQTASSAPRGRWRLERYNDAASLWT
jgi:probable phosphoglycerate mutase